MHVRWILSSLCLDGRELAGLVGFGKHGVRCACEEIDRAVAKASAASRGGTSAPKPRGGPKGSNNKATKAAAAATACAQAEADGIDPLAGLADELDENQPERNRPEPSCGRAGSTLSTRVSCPILSSSLSAPGAASNTRGCDGVPTTRLTASCAPPTRTTRRLAVAAYEWRVPSHIKCSPHIHMIPYGVESRVSL